MERVMGTISDGDRVVARDVSILMLEARPPGDVAGWQGQVDWPPDSMPPHPQRFYRLHTADGRTGQVIFIASEGTGKHAPSRLCFRTSGPFD
jgi:hypothetical protein